MITIGDAISTLQAEANTQKAAEMAAYHKAPRPYFGVANPVIDAAVKTWRAEVSLDERLTLASDLWDTNIHEARVAAAKLLVQARIKPDDAAWALITSWVPQFDGWAIADHVCSAGSRRLIANPTRIDEVETWTTSDHMWTKRAALVMTLPWTKMNNPKPADLEARERILGWAADYTNDPAWFIQKSVSWWLRELGRHDAARVWTFLDAHGDKMKPSLRKDASRNLPPR
ncbi:DNA alkylation repair protein [Octadecabacter sp. G9-8]|uniref:DNA alkylation repair protein n=1 Tax=Octadecabacter dasysiphoniae TaxID=2909341 RepID=A0ABS9CXW6_9RHOB|nr:DNA alkylation repair protein [Octadecabacter dasysiphoniae]MCF2872095.1 DNA alkylation repair protein [Octadecabacter dasysiphoniae]